MISHFILLFFHLSGVYAKVYFKEDFSDDKWEQRWIPSQHSSKDWGKFVLTAGRYYGNPEISRGIKTSEDSKFYGLTTKFEPFSNKDKVLVIQFSVKHEQNIKCGGAYLKLFDCSLKPKNFHAYVPYLIMFGPDICGAEKKVHVIFNYKERNLALKKQIKCRDDRFTHLYTLILKPDNTYTVKIDNNIERSGRLEEEWDFPPQTKDSIVTKPTDWDNNPKTEERNSTKPGDRHHPPDLTFGTSYVKDTEKEETESKSDQDIINNSVDRNGEKSNTKTTDNINGPATLTETNQPLSDSYFYKYDEICGIGFDIWQLESGTIFDNILISDNELEAEKHGNDTWGVTKENEKLMKIKVDKESSAESKRDYSFAKTKPSKHDEF